MFNQEELARLVAVGTTTSKLAADAALCESMPWMQKFGEDIAWVVEKLNYLHKVADHEGKRVSELTRETAILRAALKCLL